MNSPEEATPEQAVQLNALYDAAESLLDIAEELTYIFDPPYYRPLVDLEEADRLLTSLSKQVAAAQTALIAFGRETLCREEEE